MVSGISLANKCQLLFGCAVVLLLAAALSVPWVRTRMLVREGQFDANRQLAEAWLADQIQLGTVDYPQAQPGALPRRHSELFDDPDAVPPLRMSLLDVPEIDVESDGTDDFLIAALRKFQDDVSADEHTHATTVAGQVVYRLARPLRESDLRAIRDQTPTKPPADDVDAEDPLRAILVVERTSKFAEGQLLRNRIYIMAAGLVAGLLAVLVFYLILTKLILSPVRGLRETTEKVQGGDLTLRSEIRTGDEFEQLSEAFNGMLDRMELNQAQLRAMNESLDLKVSELSEANIGLYESNRFKSEFLTNVSHELRTPLNSIIGFAEVLNELARSDSGADPKRQRYIQNIMTSGRSLLEMIDDLLNMAKIEAGRVELNIQPTSVSDLLEGLTAIMRPQAEAKQIELQAKIGRNLPLIETDPGKLQQILYNFLSNAVKFTPAEGAVTISAERVTRQDKSLGVRLGVADTGPGIPYDVQDIIFEKFRQMDASHTREHTGAGLGLAICRELAELLGATVSVVSEPGHGATFFVDLPLTHQPDEPQPLMA
jgi:signal transduction histidine kinase